ncbi:hypothetical protein MNB_SV-10-474 [hydrothermal vent metagenome]|uniref:General secretion pathway protein K n=1 Tax=hydrothermal vent metagenome TaxID=652676 RepID=A0A1W1BTU2_9ZZZZ
MRRGFALLITLSVLAVLIALTGVLLQYFGEVRKEAMTTNALIQGNLYYTDIKKIIKKFKERKTLFTTLYSMPVPFVSPDNRFNMILKCRPVANGVNINWLKYEDNSTMAVQYNAAEKVFEGLVQKYNFVDAERLKELIVAAIGNNKNTLIREENSRLPRKNGIISLQQFRQILERYQFEADDPKVSQVDWGKLFFFSKDINVIDGDYLSPELISLLFDIDSATVKDDWVEGTSSLKDFVQSNGGTYDPKLYTQEFLEEVQCDVQYTYRDERYAFSFRDTQEEVKDFEFYGKQ